MSTNLFVDQLDFSGRPGSVSDWLVGFEHLRLSADQDFYIPERRRTVPS